VHPIFSTGKLEDLERYRHWLATDNNTLESSIQPLGVANNEKRSSPLPQYDEMVGRGQSKFMFMQEPRFQAILPGTNIQQQSSSSLMLQKAAPESTSSKNNTVLPPMLSQQVNNPTTTQRHLMGGGWDLEPTPIQFQQTEVSEPVDQRTAALARLLFNEG
jgi:hypothetical protein